MSTCVDKSTRPRPILKSLPEYSPLPFSTYPLNSPRVHFPPTPSLTSTNFTHSPFAYDRAPIVVSENTCALPERGGRCYTPQPRNKRSSRRTNVVGTGNGSGEFGSSTRKAEEPTGSYFHPHAFEVCEPEQKEEDCFSLSVGTTQQCSTNNSYFYSDSAIPPLSLPDSSDSDSSCGTLSDTCNSDSNSSNSSSTSIPCVVVDSTTPDAPATYPRLSSASHSMIQQPIYSQTSLTFTSENTQKKTDRGKSMARSRFTASRLAKYGGGFSDQAAFLEGCLGGF